jgi:hypothetical protein
LGCFHFGCWWLERLLSWALLGRRLNGADEPCMKSVFLAALAFALALPPGQSLAVEITCLSTYDADTARIAEIFQSRRRPKPSTCTTVLLNGPIVPGDAAKFGKFLRLHHPFLDEVILTSSGGSVDDAMKIGRLIRKDLIKTKAAHENNPDSPRGNGRFYDFEKGPPWCHDGPSSYCHCASACFLIWSAGVERFGSSLGLHRPTTTSTPSTDTPSNEASYSRLLLDTAAYLKEMEVPDRFIQLMVNTVSTQIRWLSGREAKSLEQVPSIAEWLTAACRAERGSDCTTLKLWKARDAISELQE